MKYMDKTAFDAANLFGLGGPNDAYAKYFVGQSYLASLPAGALHISNVTFEPGCRNNWHIHTATQGGGQVLLCIAGEGWYQEEGKPAVSLTPSCVVHIPAGVKHWHGAKADSWFSHISIAVPGEGAGTQWLEPVGDEAYSKL